MKTKLILLMLCGICLASENKGQAIRMAGVNSMPMAKTVEGKYTAKARQGECFVVKNGVVYYTTEELAEKHDLKKYRFSHHARRAASKESQTSTKIHKGRIK
jgi:hypothetical protein